VARLEEENSTQDHRTEKLVILVDRIKCKHEKTGNLRKHLILVPFREIVAVVANSKYLIF
jgi:hypothetical protein